MRFIAYIRYILSFSSNGTRGELRSFSLLDQTGPMALHVCQILLSTKSVRSIKLFKSTEPSKFIESIMSTRSFRTVGTLTQQRSIMREIERDLKYSHKR